jgi:hypothetical protein
MVTEQLARCNLRHAALGDRARRLLSGPRLPALNSFLLRARLVFSSDAILLESEHDLMSEPIGDADGRETPSPSKIAEMATDLFTIRAALIDAAGIGIGLWLSYLLLLFYLGVAAGAVNHRTLLLEEPVKLPFLGIDLPLVAFFATAPILLLVFHAYVLIHFVLLGAKIGRFQDKLARQVEGDALRDKIRDQLPNQIFVQLLAGTRATREGAIGWLLYVSASITTVLGPVVLMLLFQVQFLPYHLSWVTWLHRVVLMIDIVLLWALWPAILGGTTRITWPRLQKSKFTCAASLMILLFSITIATYPNEWQEDVLPSIRIIPTIPLLTSLENPVHGFPK